MSTIRRWSKAQDCRMPECCYSGRRSVVHSRPTERSPRLSEAKRRRRCSPSRHGGEFSSLSFIHRRRQKHAGSLATAPEIKDSNNNGEKKTLGERFAQASRRPPSTRRSHFLPGGREESGLKEIMNRSGGEVICMKMTRAGRGAERESAGCPG